MCIYYHILLFRCSWFPFAPNPPWDAFPLLFVPAIELFLLRHMSQTLCSLTCGHASTRTWWPKILYSFLSNFSVRLFTSFLLSSRSLKLTGSTNFWYWAVRSLMWSKISISYSISAGFSLALELYYIMFTRGYNKMVFSLTLSFIALKIYSEFFLTPTFEEPRLDIIDL